MPHSHSLSLSKKSHLLTATPTTIASVIFLVFCFFSSTLILPPLLLLLILSVTAVAGFCKSDLTAVSEEEEEGKDTGLSAEMDGVIGLVSRIQKACTVLGDYGDDDYRSLPSLWDALPTIVVLGGQVFSLIFYFCHLFRGRGECMYSENGVDRVYVYLLVCEFCEVFYYSIFSTGI